MVILNDNRICNSVYLSGIGRILGCVRFAYDIKFYMLGLIPKLAIVVLGVHYEPLNCN